MSATENPRAFSELCDALIKAGDLLSEYRTGLLPLGAYLPADASPAQLASADRALRDRGAALVARRHVIAAELLAISTSLPDLGVAAGAAIAALVHDIVAKLAGAPDEGARVRALYDAEDRA